MSLPQWPQRDLVGYGANPPDARWPDGAGLAVNLVINYEEGAERSPLDGDETLDGLTESPYPVPAGTRELVHESVYEYGSRVGIWRIMTLLDRYRIRPTVFACGLALERNPAVAAAFRDRQYDMVGHGYRWLPPGALTEDQTRREVRDAVEAIEQTTGQRIMGYFFRSPHTVASREILVREGFLYDGSAVNDDVPYFQEVLGRPFLIVPYSIDINDIRFWKTGFFSGADFADYCNDAFDVLRREAASGPCRMMSIGLHPRIIGRPSRFRGLERFVEHMAAQSDIWITTRTEIAQFWADRFGPENLWNHRRD